MLHFNKCVRYFCSEWFGWSGTARTLDWKQVLEASGFWAQCRIILIPPLMARPIRWIAYLSNPPRSKAASPPPRSLGHCDLVVLQNLATAGCCLLLWAVASCLAANLQDFQKSTRRGSKRPKMTPKSSKMIPEWNQKDQQLIQDGSFVDFGDIHLGKNYIIQWKIIIKK